MAGVEREETLETESCLRGSFKIGVVLHDVTLSVTSLSWTKSGDTASDAGNLLNLYYSHGQFSRQQIGDIFSYFSQKTEFEISCKLETICMKCQILFSKKNKKNIINLASAENGI